MRIKTSRISPEEIEGKEYTFSSFKNGIPFPEKKTGRLPAMGWNSWNAFGSGNTEKLTKEMAEKMVELGLRELGYSYLVLDDGCYKQERVDGRLSNEEVKFPGGFKALGNFIHEKGLKFGMYNDIGTNLCAGAAVGTCGFEDVDAQSYVEWGVDFLKVDNCYYLWDNATFSNGENARFSFAPEILKIKLVGTETELNFTAKEGKITGQGPFFSDDYVTNIGTFDGTNTGTTPVGDRSGEVEFSVRVPSAGMYRLYVTYRTGKRNGCGEWLQVAVGDAEHENRIFDGLLPESEEWRESAPLEVLLTAGENCLRFMNHRRQENTLNSYAAMFYALQAAKPGNDIVLSMCEWGKTHPQNWGYKVGDSWRILNDITFCVGRDGNPGQGSWDDPGTQSIASQYNKAVVMDEFAGLNRGWNDPDMMVIGMNDISETMSKTHMAMWCMMNSPLMLGFDLRRIKKGDELHKIIANEKLIALNQDALGIQAKRIFSTIFEGEAPDLTYVTNNDRVDVLAKPLANGDVAISFINLSRADKNEGWEVSTELILKYLGHKMTNTSLWKTAKHFEITDLWSGEVKRQDADVFKVASLPGCGNVTIRVSVKGEVTD